MSSGKLHTILIEKLVPGGLGLGRLPDGMVVLVRYVLPGEQVVIRETARRKDYITGTLEDLVSPSPDRIEPPCPYYGRCGGCDLQHATYRAQLSIKRDILAESLQRTAGVIAAGPDETIRPPLPSPAEFGYRQRIRLQVDTDGRYGFYRPGSHILTEISECPLANRAINAVLRQLHSSQSFTKLAGQCTAFELLFDPDAGNVLLLLHFKRKPRARDSHLAQSLPGTVAGLAAVCMTVADHGLFDPQTRTFASTPPLLHQTISFDALPPDLVLTWEAGGFCQVNLEQNNNLIGFVLEMMRDLPCNRILDLYCGYGNFSLPLSRISGEVVGIDSQNAAIRSAKRNLALNGITNCTFNKSRVEDGIASLVRAGEIFDTVILDPPREGAAAILPGIAALGAGRLIYISCNPATLTRDISLLHSLGYEPQFLVPVDMFPQTHHMESVTLLKREEKQPS